MDHFFAHASAAMDNFSGDHLMRPSHSTRLQVAAPPERRRSTAMQPVDLTYRFPSSTADKPAPREPERKRRASVPFQPIGAGAKKNGHGKVHQLAREGIRPHRTTNADGPGGRGIAGPSRSGSGLGGSRLLAVPSDGPPSSQDAAGASEPPEDVGWLQQTERGRLYLSKKESNAVVLEGTHIGHCIATYEGKAEERARLASGSFVIKADMKVAPQGPFDGQVMHLLFDTQKACDYSSGCDFTSLQFNTSTRDFRVESFRPRGQSRTLQSLPGCSVLQPNRYINVRLECTPSSICVYLNGVLVIDKLPTPRELCPCIGIGVYGKTRMYVRRFCVSLREPPGGQINPASCQPPEDEANTQGERPAPASASSSTAIALPDRDAVRTNDESASAPRVSSAAIPPRARPQQAVRRDGVGGGGVGIGMGVVPPGAREEMEFAGAIEQDVLQTSLNVSFDDIAALDDAKRLLTEAVVLPLIVPEYFTGIREPWKGVLMFGPPGTGKTLLAKAVASMGHLTFFNCTAASLVSKWRGESEKLVRALFQMARRRAPSIIFFDEIDALMSQRGTAAEHEASRRFKAEVLSQMDGLLSRAAEASADGEGGDASSNLVMVLATSNMPWDLDEGLRRRLEKRIYIPLPDDEARRHMFTLNLRNVDVGDDVSIEELAAQAEGFSGSDIHLLCREACMEPMRRLIANKTALEIKQMKDEGRLPQAPKVSEDDFRKALESTAPSVNLDDVAKHEEWQRIYGAK
ncbi:unnamed protein product [Vitrella brassicaformis CCMP3155]|uniref:Katanin p60 ATPase-containing subunit A1 n=4 Tax=Vitrella brassicaformis TaxID=1169539 RepID=A0A0G4EQ93_VITBC|nr:unnamed protein product [Vitrella brassicaformis CCMP3155]|eukprot:CEL99589.1 unnamed protein product [Vitrella brassicaformis CCMP3155]